MSERFVFHEKEAPRGIKVHVSEAEAYYAKGWVDTPAKFGAKKEGNQSAHPVAEKAGTQEAEAKAEDATNKPVAQKEPAKKKPLARRSTSKKRTAKK